MPKSRKYEGVVYRRKESSIWWIRYRDRNGNRRRESTLTEDWREAQKKLRERLDARDNNVLAMGALNRKASSIGTFTEEIADIPPDLNGLSASAGVVPKF